MKFSLPLLLSCAVLASPVSAVVVNIDFNSGTNTQTELGAAPDDPGNTYWNGVQVSANAINAANLNASSHTESEPAPTTIGLTMTGVDEAIAAATGQQDRSGDNLNLMRDYLRINSGSTATVRTESGTFSGLTAGGFYDLYFYGQGQYFDDPEQGTAFRGQNTLFTVGSESKATDWDEVPGGNGILTENVEYVKFTAQADSSGEITFSWSNVIGTINGPDPDGISPGSRYAALNGIQLVSVPETSAALLGSLGMLALLLRRR